MVKNQMQKFRINEAIKAKVVRVIGDDGIQLGIFPFRDALLKAKEAGLDLVEVAYNTDLSVCKLIDFSKFKYEQSIKDRNAKKNNKELVIKNIRLTVKIGENDLKRKIDDIIEFFKKNNKVIVTLQLYGREASHPTLATEILERVRKETKSSTTEVCKKQGNKFIIQLDPPKHR